MRKLEQRCKWSADEVTSSEGYYAIAMPTLRKIVDMAGRKNVRMLCEKENRDAEEPKSVSDCGSVKTWTV